MDDSANWHPMSLCDGYNEVWKQYWDNFNAMKAWFRHHYAYTNWTTASAMSTQPQPDWRPGRYHRRKRRQRRRKRAQWKLSRKARSKRKRCTNRAGQIAQSRDDTEVDNEFLSFMMVTKLHRQERDAMKMKTNREDVKQSWLTCTDGEYIDVEKVSIYYRPSRVEDLQAPKADRRSIARMMYGAAGDKIYDMEEAMQARFDAEIDSYGPPLWPATPLRL
uniref:Uncharacterized protein n=1 Tax=Trichuris muris TaxID=70415 RepID=A0A5S6QGS4_TRIMR